MNSISSHSSAIPCTQRSSSLSAKPHQTDIAPTIPLEDLEPPEDPYSTGFHHVAYFFGGVIGLLSITVPLATVMSGRQQLPETLTIHGSQPAAGMPSARAGESGGGNSSGLP